MKYASDFISLSEGVIELKNGVCECRLGEGHAGVTAMSLRRAVEECGGMLKGHFSNLPSDTDGVFVKITEGAAVENVCNVIVSGKQPSSIIIVAGAGAKCGATFIFEGEAVCERKVFLEEGAEFRAKDLFLGSKDKEIVFASEIGLTEKARCETVTIEIGEGRSSLKYMTALGGRYAESLHYGIFMAADEEEKSIDVRAEHNVADCHSDVMIKGVASGTGRGSFKGMVYVAPDAQRTEAYQQSRNLIMGGEAKILTSPQLEIYADDVKCSHGATVGQMDDDAVYYMRQRGLTESEAKGLQLTGFVNDIISRLGEGETTDKIRSMSEQKIVTLQEAADSIYCDK